MGQFQKFDQLTKSTDSFSKWASSIANHTFTSVSGVISSVTKLSLLITMPFILFYLLKTVMITQIFSTFSAHPKRKGFIELLDEINGKWWLYPWSAMWRFVLQSCFRGIRDHWTKICANAGIAAGVLNLIPYLGSFLAIVPQLYWHLFLHGC